MVAKLYLCWICPLSSTLHIGIFRASPETRGTSERIEANISGFVEIILFKTYVLQPFIAAPTQ